MAAGSPLALAELAAPRSLLQARKGRVRGALSGTGLRVLGVEISCRLLGVTGGSDVVRARELGPRADIRDLRRSASSS